MIDKILHNSNRNHLIEPDGGIPRQFLPNFIRWPIRALVVPFVILDIFAQKIAKFIIKPPYKQIGKCKKRGNCCHYILIRKLKWPFSILDKFWHTEINGFYRRDKNVYKYNNINVYLMGCRYFTKDGKCCCYHMRPAICRMWPRIEYFGYPKILPGCGFKAVKRD